MLIVYNLLNKLSRWFFFVALEHHKQAKASRKKKHMAVHFVLLSLKTLGLIDIFLTTYPSNVREK